NNWIPIHFQDKETKQLNHLFSRVTLSSTFACFELVNTAKVATTTATETKSGLESTAVKKEISVETKFEEGNRTDIPSITIVDAAAVVLTEEIAGADGADLATHPSHFLAECWILVATG
ncbi:hypothetical protein F441_06860, partial [Phytophthora nicotianae CJ01A1]